LRGGSIPYLLSASGCINAARTCMDDNRCGSQTEYLEHDYPDEVIDSFSTVAIWSDSLGTPRYWIVCLNFINPSKKRLHRRFED
jgi:hypothetical protein